MKFRIRSSVFGLSAGSWSSTVRPLTLLCPTIEEASLLGEVDSAGHLVPRNEVFLTSFHLAGPVIEGFEDCALGVFVSAQLEALLNKGLLPARCEINGLEPFLEPDEPEDENPRDLISICEFRASEFTPESAVQFLKESGFFDEYIITGVKYGRGWRRSRCITTFEGRPRGAAKILGHLSEYFKAETNGQQHQ